MLGWHTMLSEDELSHKCISNVSSDNTVCPPK